MAKLGLVFICVFLTVQLTLAARLVRDAPAETPTPAEGSNPNSMSLNDILANISQGIQKTLSKQNIDKLMENFGEAGDKLKEFGQTLIDRAQATAADLAHGAKKDEKPATT